MTERKHMALRRFTSLEEMKAEEYRYWQSRPGYERIRAVSEMAEEWYGASDSTPDESPLRRIAVRVKR